MKPMPLLLFCLLLAVIGAVGGWLARGQTVPASDDAAHAHDEPPTRLPAQTLANLGVTTGPLEVDTFSRTRDIPAMIEHAPLNQAPVFALTGGRIERLLVEPGTVVKAGQPLMTIVRDPIPRPTLALTEAILQPTQEAIHQAALSLRKTGEEASILAGELKRLRSFGGGPDGGEVVIPRQRIIDCENKLRRASAANSSARQELRAHGFSSQQLADIEKNGHLPALGGRP